MYVSNDTRFAKEVNVEAGAAAYRVDNDNNVMNNNNNHLLHAKTVMMGDNPSSNAGITVAPSTKYNDLPFSILFYAHFILISYLGFSMGIPEIRGTAKNVQALDYPVQKDEQEEEESSNAKVGGEVMGGLAICAFVGIIISVLYVKLAIRMGESLIHTGAKFQIGLFTIFAIGYFATGAIGGGAICLVFAAITLCWYRVVANRIPFAGANLSVACHAT